MANVATLAIKVTTDADKAAKDLDAVGKKAGGFQSGLNKAAAGAAVAGAAVIAFGKSALDAASDAQQAAGSVDAIYGDTADTIHGFAKTAATDTGLASSEYENMAAVFGAQLKNMGVDAKNLAPMTNDLVGLGADLAAQFGGSTADAVAALSSLLKGERDPIEKYGVAIKAADVEAQKATMGLAGLTGEADKAATTQATLALLSQQTADAHGAFARETESAAGATQIANAQWKDTQAQLGKVLLPIVARAMSMFRALAGFVGDNSGAFQVLGGIIAGVAAVILTIKVATMAWEAAQKVARAATLAWQAAQWLLNAAMNANPIGLVITAIAALIAIIVILVKNWDTVKLVAEKVFAAILVPIRKVIDLIQGLIDKVKSVINWIGKIKIPDIGGFIDKINPFAVAPAPARFAAPAVGIGAHAMGTTSSAAGGITINVTGALDPDAVARQIERVLRSRVRRVGGVGRVAAGIR